MTIAKKTKHPLYHDAKMPNTPLQRCQMITELNLAIYATPVVKAKMPMSGRGCRMLILLPDAGTRCHNAQITKKPVVGSLKPQQRQKWASTHGLIFQSTAFSGRIYSFFTSMAPKTCPNSWAVVPIHTLWWADIFIFFLNSPKPNTCPNSWADVPIHALWWAQG